jgi:hypothetical protein
MKSGDFNHQLNGSVSVPRRRRGGTETPELNSDSQPPSSPEEERLARLLAPNLERAANE